MDSFSLAERIREYAFCFVGLPYIWGGDDPINGFDCSGLAQEILAAFGIKPAGDNNAQSLYNYFVKNSQPDIFDCGAIAFYGKDLQSISHVAVMIDGLTIIEAGHGGPSTLTREDAIKQNAYVRLRTVKYRGDFLAVLMPRYPRPTEIIGSIQ